MGTKEDLIGLSQYTWGRTKRRLEDITDAEYLWEPVPGGWSVRTLADGRSIVDGDLWRGPHPPFTNLAWRISHVIDIYGSPRNGLWLRVESKTPAINDGRWSAPPDAATAIEMLERAAGYWHGLLDALTEETLDEKIGPVGGEYADETLRAFVYHQLEEAIHHGAEVGVLRDLYHWTVVAPPSELTLEVLRDDPGAVAKAAHRGRWDLVEQLALAGCDVNGPDRSPLHQVAAVGDLGLVQLLVERGADTGATDLTWKATPAQWARAFGRAEVADFLEAQSS